MIPLGETHGTRFELVRHFLLRMFDSEMFTVRGQWRAAAIGAVALAFPAGMLLLNRPHQRDTFAPTLDNLRAAAIGDQVALLIVVFAAAGVLALLAWQSLFPSRRDYTALAGLPVGSREIFAARFVAMNILGAALGGSLSIPLSVLAAGGLGAGLGLHAQAAAKTAACLTAFAMESVFTFFAVVALQGVLVNLLPAKWFGKISTYAQGLLLAALMFAGLCGTFAVDWREQAVTSLGSFSGWAPPFWFAGLELALAGGRAPVFSALAGRALAATGIAAGLALLSYALAYRRYRRLLIEGTEGAARLRSSRWSPLGLMARDPRRVAILRFIAAVFSRSRVHRLVLLAYAGAGLGLMVNSAAVAGIAQQWSGGWSAAAQFICLVWPLGISCVMLAGIRHAFSMPAELSANWIFHLTENQGRRQWMSAVERFLIVMVIAPIHLATLPVAVGAFGWGVALRMGALQALVSLTAMEALFNDWQQLPFACSYIPAKRPIVIQLMAWMGAMLIVLPLLAMLIGWLSKKPETFLFGLAALGVAWIWARWAGARDGARRRSITKTVTVSCRIWE